MKQRSFIYSMLAGVAVFTLASCAESVSEFFGLEDKDVITFTATTDDEVSDLTRAAINEDSRVTVFKDTESDKPLLLSSSVTKRDVEATRGHRVTSATELTKFRVSAAIGSKNISEEDFALLTPNYFYNVKAEKSNNIYEIERDYYWPSSSEKLWFYAYAPCDDNNVAISDQNLGGPQKVTFSVDTDVTKQVDLMTADASSTAFTAASGETTKTSVALNFRHELTAIRFIIGEQWLAGSIKSIGIYNVHGKGTMTIGAEDATKWAWTNKAGTSTYSATDDFVLTVDKGGLTGAINEQFIEDEDLYFLMIPQAFDDNNDAYVEVKYQDNAREYTVRAPLKGQSAWVRNTTVTYAISSHELTKLKIGSIAWPSNSGEGVWNGPKTDFAFGDEVGLYVVDPDGLNIQSYYRNVKCTYVENEGWIIDHPEDHPVFKLPGYQYFFYYPYTSLANEDAKYPVAGQNNTNTEASAFFSHLIDGWMPAASQETAAKLDGQDLQVAKGVDDAQLSSTVNVTMAHQMNLAKLQLGTKSITDTWVYPIDNDHTWRYVPDAHDLTASSSFNGNVPYLHSDNYYYYVFKPVEDESIDVGTTLTAFKPNTFVEDWSWEMKSQERGKMLSHTAESSSGAQNIMHENELSIAQILAQTATGSELAVPVSVTINNAALTKGTDYTVSYKNSANETVTAPTVAGNYTAIFTPTGRYSGDAVTRAFMVNKAGKTITFANANMGKTYGDAAYTEAVTNTGTGTVTYSSGNTNVATVNSSSGQVTIKAAGSATITATVADSEYDSYATKTASYTLTVGPKALNSTEFKFASATLNKTYVWEIRTSTNALTKPDGCVVTYTSDYDGVASVVDPSTGALSPGGTLNAYATITATATGNYSGTATYRIKATKNTVNFAYTGAAQSLSVGPGTYRIECWGANGGPSPTSGSSVAKPGVGGYCKGDISFTSSKSLYVFVGGVGKNNVSSRGGSNAGGWNGGGYSSKNSQAGGYEAGSGGGGSTDVRVYVNSSMNWNNTTSLCSRIIVAGGGGGCGYVIAHNYNSEIGGCGGGLIGGTGSDNTYYAPNGATTPGGTQTESPYSTQEWRTGGFGYACQSANPANTDSYGCGGGGGWYGGPKGSGNGGGGGSSFISGHVGCVSHPDYRGSANNIVRFNNEDYEFGNTQMIDGDGYLWNSASEQRVYQSWSVPGLPKIGNTTASKPGVPSKPATTTNGYCRITWVGN